MTIYRGRESAERAARLRAKSEDQAFLIFRGPRGDHIIWPKAVSAPDEAWPGGRRCWTQVVEICSEHWDRAEAGERY